MEKVLFDFISRHLSQNRLTKFEFPTESAKPAAAAEPWWPSRTFIEHFVVIQNFLGVVTKKNLIFVILFWRRGSNLSLLLDVSALGVESMCSVTTPKEVWLQLLHTSSRPLTHAALQEACRDTKTLNSEYQVTLSDTKLVTRLLLLHNISDLFAPRLIPSVFPSPSAEDPPELCQRGRPGCPRTHDQRPIQKHPSQSVAAQQDVCCPCRRISLDGLFPTQTLRVESSWRTWRKRRDQIATSMQTTSGWDDVSSLCYEAGHLDFCEVCLEKENKLESRR